MNGAQLLEQSFTAIQRVVHSAVKGADERTLTFQPDDRANTVAWLVWHLSRVQDSHLAELREAAEVWTADGWADRFALPFDPDASGYGQSVDEVRAVKVDAELLVGYYDAVHTRTVEYLRTLGDSDFDRIVDESWDPPVTLGVRLSSVIADDLQHAGQASYVRGLADRAQR